MKIKSHFAELACYLAILFLPTTLLACFQIGGDPAILHNKDVKVRFTFDGKPIPNASVSLWDHKRRTVSKSQTDSNGWCVFEGISAGEYKVVLNGPSYESFRIELKRSEVEKTAMRIDFSGDWCNQIAIIQDKS